MSWEMHQRVREAAQKRQKITQTGILALEHSSQAVERGGKTISQGVQVFQAVSEIFIPGVTNTFGVQILRDRPSFSTTNIAQFLGIIVVGSYPDCIATHHAVLFLLTAPYYYDSVKHKSHYQTSLFSTTACSHMFNFTFMPDVGMGYVFLYPYTLFECFLAWPSLHPFTLLEMFLLSFSNKNCIPAAHMARETTSPHADTGCDPYWGRGWASPRG